MTGVQTCALPISGNNYLEGRAQLEKENRMTYINPGQTIQNRMTVRFHDNQDSWKEA